MNKTAASVEGQFRFRSVSCREVRDTINSIKSGAVGNDGITIGMIKMVGPYVIDGITHLINRSLATGVFPEVWKEAIVIPLPKVKAPVTVAELRPISVLPALSKVLEKLVAAQFVEFLERENIIPPLQSGFRKGFSTTTALLHVCDDLINAKVERKSTAMAMLDFSCAFDSINHDLLLAIMRYYRVQRESVAWFSSYLSGRRQRTKIGIDFSSSISRSLGVPQGSCLGPILFTLFAATMGDSVQHCKLYSYADDAQLSLSYRADLADQATRRMNSDLDLVHKWSMDHGVKLNTDKCALFNFPGSKCVSPSLVTKVSIGGTALKECESAKLLGIVFDTGLTFSSHVSTVCQKAISRLRVLYRNKHLFPQDTKLRLVQALVLSAFDYCLPVYGNVVTAGDMQRMQRVQNMCVRFVCGLRKYDHISSARTDLGLLPMADMCTLRTAMVTHRILKSNTPAYLREKLKTRSEVRSRITRQDAVLELPRVRRELERKRFGYFAPFICNTLLAVRGEGPDSEKTIKRKVFDLLSVN